MMARKRIKPFQFQRLCRYGEGAGKPLETAAGEVRSNTRLKPGVNQFGAYGCGHASI
jgi:hypothetical protein